MVGAVLLAAGAGSRLGNRPKSLLELGGVPLIRRQLIALSGAGVDEVVVVLGHHAEAIEAAVRDFPVTLARNPEPDAGQASSVRVGLHALTGKLDAVIVALADQPLVNAQDIGGEFRTRSLQSILGDHPRFSSAKLLKTDTEGFDFRIIQSAFAWLRSARPLIFLEY